MSFIYLSPQDSGESPIWDSTLLRRPNRTTTGDSSPSELVRSVMIGADREPQSFRSPRSLHSPVRIRRPQFRFHGLLAPLVVARNQKWVGADSNRVRRSCLPAVAGGRAFVSLGSTRSLRSLVEPPACTVFSRRPALRSVSRFSRPLTAFAAGALPPAGPAGRPTAAGRAFRY